ncbi:MAG: hypothetical protein KJP09_01170, partial [Bacteroidia bacterium]|nr:hypothetical protein [Bacteroidia bacterium]
MSCGGAKLPTVENGATSNFPSRKAYVVIRSEGGPSNVQRVRNILSADFQENNVMTNFALYRAKQSWNQTEIYNSAYDGQYDYIILIDQIAKFTIDNQTQVGGKYQIRSYHVKSPNPNWLDLGQSTCNLSVEPSVQKFSREVIRSIVGNSAVFKNHDFEYDESLADTKESVQVNDAEASNDLIVQIEMLRKELDAEKKRTKVAQQERDRLENMLKLEIEAQKEKTRIAQIEAEEATLRKKQRQREIAETYAAKKAEIEQREAMEAEEAYKNPQPVVEEPKELTREERLSIREETKRRQAEEREAQRLAAKEALEERKEERRRLAELKRTEQKRLREELEA